MKFSLETAPNYEKHYDEKTFWKKLKSIATKVGRKVLVPALVLYDMLQSPTVSTKDKAIIIGALGYLILPTDLIPDFIPLLGFTDDLSAMMLAIRTLKKDATPEIIEQAQRQADALLGVAQKETTQECDKE